MDVLKELVTTEIISLTKHNLKDVRHWAENFEKDIRCSANEMADNIIENFFREIEEAGRVIAGNVRFDMEHEE